ncbi:MAG: 4a-hydroxytetrahydrobiopterin dehydratase [bacterium]
MLSQQNCEPCKSGVPALSPTEIQPLIAELGSDWQVVKNHHLYRKFNFKNFVDALVFTNKIGAIAEDQHHHPNIALTWGEVEVKIYTHKINGLQKADFVLAAKISNLI